MKTRTKHVPIAIAALTLGLVGLSACNTMRGAGQDIQGAGSAVSQSATEVQKDMNDGNPHTP